MKRLLQAFISAISALIFNTSALWGAEGLLPPFQDLSKVPILRVDQDPDYKIDFSRPQLLISQNTLMYSFSALRLGDVSLVAGCPALKTFADLYKTQSELFVKDGIAGVAIMWRVLVSGKLGKDDSEYAAAVFGYTFSHNQGYIILMQTDKDDVISGVPLLSAYNATPADIAGACIAHIQRLRGIKPTSLF